MILMRIQDVPGLYCFLHQSKYKYNEDGKGWFPVESLNFGFNSSSGKDEAGAANGNGATADGPQRPQPTAAGRVARTGPPGAEQEEAFQTMTVAKYVDGMTTALMGYAMEDRLVTKSERDEMRKADIHFVHATLRSGEKEQTITEKKEAVVPYLMITLESVLVKGWSIGGEGDDRPTENLELWFDKAAMRYYYSQDGGVWKGGQAVGWDQYENKPWLDPSSPYFAEH